MFNIPKQCYDIPSGNIINQFVGVLSIELDRIWNCQWNAVRLIIFQTFLLQLVSGVSGLINIHGQIESRIDLWKKGAYCELVLDPHIAVEEALGNKRRNQT